MDSKLRTLDELWRDGGEMKKVHKLDWSTEDDALGGTYEYAWPVCRDPERWNEVCKWNLKLSRRWDDVTCSQCLARKEEDE